MLEALEWAAFLLGAATVWRYGYSQLQGAVLGMTCAAVFILWGALSGVWAAPAVNVGFFLLHANNFRRANL